MFVLLLLLVLPATCRYAQLNLLHAYLISINIITFLFYGFDKHRALKNQSRIPESVLHLLALAGATPAALLGQIIFNHKTRKRKFRLIFFLILALQINLLALYVYNHTA